MKYLWSIIYIILLPLALKSNEVYVNIGSQKHVFKPGTSTSIPVTLINQEGISIAYEISTLSRTDKITVLTSTKVIKIEPKQKETVLLPINIAKDCSNGNHIIVLKVLNLNNTSYQLFDINIQVSKNDELLVAPLSNTEYIKAGDTITSEFTITNAGNTRQSVNINTNNGIIKSETSLYLKPQEQRIVTVYTITNRKSTKPYNQIIDLNIVRSNTLIATAFTNVNVIPINPEKLDIYKRFPIQLTLRYINMRHHSRNSSGFQGELFTRTNLSQENNGFLEIKLATKNPVSQYYYTLNDEYYATYSTNNTYIHVGDKVFSSSILTEHSRYGRGLELKHKFSKIEVGAFYNRPRFFNTITEEFNINSTISLNDKSSLKVGYLQKQEKLNKSKNSTSVHLPFAIYTLNAIKNTALELEFAYSNNNRLSGSAYRIGLTTKLSKFGAGFNYIYSSPEFRGYYNNTKNLNGTINYRFSRKINVFANHYQNTRNEQRDTLLLSAPLFNLSQFGLDYNYANSGQLSLFNGYTKNEDRLSKILFKYEEYFTRMNINQQIKSLRINFFTQFGYTKNYLTNTNGKSYIQQLNLSTNQLKTNISLFATYTNTYRYELGKTNNYYYGGQLSKNIAKNTLFYVLYQNNHIPEDYYQERSQFESILSHNYKNHLLELSGRYFIQRGQIGKKDFQLLLTYKTTLNVPIKKIHFYSSLKGNIKNQNENLKGVRVQLGDQYAITDKEGNYIFKNISPGNYYLDIDRASLPIDAVSTTSLPQAITIENNDLNQLDFIITKAASIQGDIKFIENMNHSFSNNDKQEILATNIIIEASDGNKTLRKMTQINKSFNFTALQPGLWTIKVYTRGPNRNLKVDPDNYELNLTAGETKNLSINIKHVPKEIFRQQETIKVGYLNPK